MSKRSAVFLAAQVLASVDREACRCAIVIVAGEHGGEMLGRLLDQMAPDRVCRFLPAWDCLPYDRASPSPEILGRRMRAIHDLAEAGNGAILVTTPEAALQRLPCDKAALEPLRIEVGEPIDAITLGSDLERMGYATASEVDDVGHYALRGEVIDLFPAGSAPYRIVVETGTVAEIHQYDPVSQRRSKTAHRAIRVGPASEIVGRSGEAAVDRSIAIEHWLPLFEELGTVFTLLPEADVFIEPEASGRVDVLLQQIGEAYEARVGVDRRIAKAAVRPVLPPDRLYLTAEDWQKSLHGRTKPFPADVAGRPVPNFALQAKAGRAFRDFLQGSTASGRRLVLAARGARTLAALTGQAKHATGEAPTTIERWSDVAAAAPGAVLAMRLSADQGFVDEASGVTVVAASDLFGSRVTLSHHAVHAPWHGVDGEFAFDDAVVHLDHGLGVLRKLETVEDNDRGAIETARLDFAHDTDLLSPVDAFHRIWRYGSGGGVTLDRLHGDAWPKRRGKIMEEIGETARQLVSLARRRAETETAKLVPPSAAYERFCNTFPFPLTPDQAHAVADVLHDLASGRAMDRLIIGDVGFGKTEVAMRAAAAAVLAGRQVAVIAPTTVLVRQHVQNFRRRFEAIGIEVAHLSRLAGGAEVNEAKEGLATGRTRIVVGTHALTGKTIEFHDLGLLIIDEEQRFGTSDKAKLRSMGSDVHTLTMSATPIPRTLQSALVGLQEISAITTAPARRRPIRTVPSPFDRETIRTALTFEQARGGQSFVVVPRIEDLERLTATVQDLAPTLSILVAHGGLEAQQTDGVMLDFAEGRGDVLLATSIIESGLDVPRANTMIVIDADRFGLAQLHQLRGRVGRGRQQGICYLMTDPDRPIADATQRRLSTLAAHDRLGSGMAISLHDLDLRGAGDLLGDTQAGHMRLIGLGLYQHLLHVAVRQARGEAVEDWTPEIHADGAGGTIPAHYIPEAIVRLNLYARIARVADGAEIDGLAEEIEDRFGAMPPEMETLLAQARLRSLCRSHAIRRVDIGPKAVAFSPGPDVRFADILPHVPHRHREALVIKEGRMIYSHTLDKIEDRLQLASRLLGDMP